MTDTFTVTISTPERQIYSGTASSLVVPAVNGSMGILAHHAPIVAMLRAGTVTLKDASGAESSYESKAGGFVEFSRNTATLLLEK